MTISAPEGIELHIVLAGAASRYIAGAIDLALQALIIIVAAVVLPRAPGGGVGVALLVMAIFAALFLYDILFELLASGRTPGKRLTHLRVVRAQGGPVDFPASAVRNLLRPIDFLPFGYLVGVISIMLTKRNQRLGDLAAGTLVVREPSGPSRRRRGAGARKRGAAGEGAESVATSGVAPDWDVSAVSVEELATVRRFLERREELDGGSRNELAVRLERGLRGKVAGAPDSLAGEPFLEALVRAKSARA